LHSRDELVKKDSSTKKAHRDLDDPLAMSLELFR